MQSLRFRLLFTFGSLYIITLAGLGFILGQLFPLLLQDSIKTNIVTSKEKVTHAIEQQHLSLTNSQRDAIINSIGDHTKIQDVSDIRLQLWILLGIIFMLAFIILILVTYRLIKNLSQPIDNMMMTAFELAKGNYRARAFEVTGSFTLRLSKAINILARNLQDMAITREIEQERLKTLIENMGSALIMIGREGDITIVNRTFTELFDQSYEDVQRQQFRELGLPHELEEFVDYVFMTEVPYRKQLHIQLQQEFRDMEVYGAPVVGEHGLWLGIVIVMHDITELKKLEQVRKDFVANVSHELRTPITSIKGFSETLLDGAYKDQETLLGFLKIMNKESNRLQMLVNDLLDLSKIEKSGFTVNMEKTSLRDVIIRTIEMTHQKLEKKHIQFEAKIDEDVYINGDPNRLVQIVMNLVINAINYSPEQTKITVHLFEKDQTAILEISDEGIGISEEEIPRVFERFYRVNRDRSRNSGGTGLGLAIVKHLVEAHRGKIQVESTVGEGTTMRLLFPKA
ncbi:MULTISPECIES: two-component system histidine kinase PnpS [Rummeliibacillus]|jgi:two-component system phosphate regulon sensor histidine kinase PhoR|uniref:two-component system histidine kinase PnpS n=1 Tax=Rummeliibacillus TaxID=648802 RepID=UPI0011B5E399|nr:MULTISPECIES: ATP-binding protein [Rummeliibacillus]MBO2536906.1 PAS domain S-box protein [Rummeliibacillus suwonensis]